MCACVDLGALVIDHFHSNLSDLSGLSGQRVRHSGNTVNIAHTTLTCHNFFLFFWKENCRGWHQSQKYTAETKMSAVCHIKITGPLTPVMKRNKGDSKVNTIFSLFPRKKSSLAGFALLLLVDCGALLKETSSGITAWRYFFFLLAITTSCPVSALPETHWYNGLFCWVSAREWSEESCGQNRTADPGHQWLMSNVTVKPNRGCCTFDFIGHHVRLSVVQRPALLQCKSLYVHAVETLLDNRIMIRWGSVIEFLTYL